MTMSRTELIRLLAKAASQGKLGLLVGSGFSIAISPQALTWGNLLTKVAEHVDVDVPTTENVALGTSFPEVATILVDNLAKALTNSASSSDPHEQAERRIRSAVCKVTGFQPDKSLQERARAIFGTIKPAWVVTTNYDLLLESVIPNAEFLTAEQPISLRSHVVPVYHMHGHRLAPESLVVTSRDYGQLFSHVDYRHQRLAGLFAESTTVVMGYSLSDFNVQICLNRSADFSPKEKEHRRDGQGRVVMVQWVAPGKSAQLEPYLHHGRLVLETNSILSFLDELKLAIDAVAHEWDLFEAEFRTSIETGQFGIAIVSSPQTRLRYINSLRDFPGVRHRFEMEQQILEALKTKNELAHGGADGWDHYSEWLDVPLDFFEHWPLGEMPPQLFEVLAESLASISYNIEIAPEKRTKGKAWDASFRWRERKSLFAAPERRLVRQALVSYAERTDDTWMAALMSSIPAS